MKTNRPTVAEWTPPGRGAIAVIRVRGELSEASEQLTSTWKSVSGWTIAETPIGRLSFGRWGDRTPEEVVVCRLDEQTFEVQCHGGVSAVRRIIDELIAAGCVETNWKTQCLTTRDDDAHFDVLPRATTLRAAAWLAWQLGRMTAELQRLERHRVADPAATREAAMRHLRWSDFGRHLTQPWSIVVTGRPNVGKSSLINALVGFDRSIVFDQPGTTRDIVSVETVWDGWAFRLIDTAGDRHSDDQLETTGIARARTERSTADLTLLVLDFSEPLQPDDWRLIEEEPDALLVANKADLPERWSSQRPTDIVAVSSREKTGLSNLATMIVQRLIPTLPPSDAIVPLNEWQITELQQLAKG